ncbi:hypothetical protein AD945_03865, partial [Gluconobacter albidus]
MSSDPDQADTDGLSVEAIQKLLAQHGILIEEDDPVFRVLLANRIVLNAYFSEAEASFTRTSNRGHRVESTLNN